MKLLLVLAMSLACVTAPTWSSDEAFALSAATAVDRTVKWQAKSTQVGDFTCDGKRELAILGTTKKLIVIAVFRPSSPKPIDILRFSGSARDPKSAILTIEPLDFDLKDLEQHLGYVPEGLESSRTCVGLNMSDQMVDSAHIYWHKRRRRFESWSL